MEKSNKIIKFRISHKLLAEHANIIEIKFLLKNETTSKTVALEQDFKIISEHVHNEQGRINGGHISSDVNTTSVSHNPSHDLLEELKKKNDFFDVFDMICQAEIQHEEGDKYLLDIEYVYENEKTHAIYKQKNYRLK